MMYPICYASVSNPGANSDYYNIIYWKVLGSTHLPKSDANVYRSWFLLLKLFWLNREVFRIIRRLSKQDVADESYSSRY